MTPLNYLTNSIEPQGTSSGGRSVAPFVTHWGLNLSGAEATTYVLEDRFTLNITGNGDEPLHLEGYGKGEDAYTRATCMIIVGLMPPQGLGETIDTLKDICQFYADPPARRLPSPKVFETNALITSIE